MIIHLSSLLQRLRDLEATLRKEGLSRDDCKAAVAAVKRWLLRDAEDPGPNTPRDAVVPEDSTNPQEHNHGAEA